jgi:hypothetical protein
MLRWCPKWLAMRLEAPAARHRNRDGRHAFQAVDIRISGRWPSKWWQAVSRAELRNRRPPSPLISDPRARHFRLQGRLDGMATPGMVSPKGTATG